MYSALIRRSTSGVRNSHRVCFSTGHTNVKATRPPSEATVLLKQGKLDEALQVFYKKPNSIYVASSLISHLGRQNSANTVQKFLTVYNECKKTVKPDTALLISLVDAARRQKDTSDVIRIVWADIQALKVPVDSHLLSNLLMAHSESPRR